MRRWLKQLVLSSACLAFAAGAATAQDYPTEPIRLIVPFSPGGSIDIVTRLIAPALSEELGQPVVVENRTGASGNVGGEYVANADPDGYTIIMHGLPLATQPYLTASMPFDPLTDFEPITVVALQPNMLVVHPDLEVSSVQELIDYAKKHPGELNFASSGPGATQHLAAELLMQLADIDLVHVPYQGGGSAMTDVLGGRVQMMIETAPSAMPYAQSGQVRALGVTTTERLAAMPDLPTIEEAGVPGYELASWLLLLAPAGTPEDIIDTLYQATTTVLSQPEIVERFSELGLQVGGHAPEETAEFLREETESYGKLIESIGLEPQ